MSKKRLIPFLFGLVPVIMIGYFGLAFVAPAVAQTSTASVSDECHITDVSKAIRLSIYIPGVTEMLVGDEQGNKYPYVQNMSCFIADMYRYLAGAAGILAVTMMIYGGIKYTVSFGNPSTLSDARDTISSAMIGLALVLGSYVILNFINPKITSLSVPYLDTISKENNYEGYTIVKMCDSSLPHERNADGSPIQCGKKALVYPDDPDVKKQRMVCIGYDCPRALFGKFTFCNATGFGSYDDGALMFREGSCMGGKFTGVEEEKKDDPNAKKYVVSTETGGAFTAARDCGGLGTTITSGDIDWLMGTECPDGQSCLALDATNPVLYYYKYNKLPPDVPHVTATVRDMECKKR